MFDPKKPVQTRDGRQVRILATDLKIAGFPIGAAILNDTGEETLSSYNRDGMHLTGIRSRCDLVNIPETRWVNLYRSNYRITASPPRRTREEAQAGITTGASFGTYLTTVEIPWD